MPEHMRAAVFVRPHEVAVDTVPVPEPSAGQVRIRVEGTGVCASNLPLWDGAPWFEYPLAPGLGGHESWGVVEHVGPGVSPQWIGKRVVALSGRAYAERDIAQVDQLVEIPEALHGAPCPGEALGCAMNIYARSDVRSGQTVAIVGIGFLGALLTRLASRAGARVIAISRRAESLELARRMGAHDVVPMHDHGAILERVRDLTHGSLCDRAIEAVGKQWPLDLAAELTREHGKLIVAGYHQDGPRQVNMQLWNWRGLDVINAHERDPRVAVSGMRAALSAVSEGWLDPTPLYSHHFSLSQLGHAFEALRDRPPGFVKALVQMGGAR